jgi:secondary thiamine-phosphate synthase enzyme
MHRDKFAMTLNGRGTYEITEKLQSIVHDSQITTGMCNVFIHHTSASLIVCENADPTVRTDLETFLSKWVPDGHKMFKHMDEGNDDMPAHVRTVMTHTSLVLPVTDGELDLGDWQGIFIYEHRADVYTRRVTVSVY